MAHVAECVDRLDTALHLLTTLDAAAQRFELAAWEPALAFEAKHHLWRLLKIRRTVKVRTSPRLARAWTVAGRADCAGSGARRAPLTAEAASLETVLMNSPTKDNEILRYYEAEMRYLREAGKEFAQAFPDRARRLNIDRIGERDPHVERLFEGFAFLMGHLRHKLDDELPEFTEGLVEHVVAALLTHDPVTVDSRIEPGPWRLTATRDADVGAGSHVRCDPDPPGTALRRATCRYGDSRVHLSHDAGRRSVSAAAHRSECDYAREDGHSVLRFRFELQPQGIGEIS